MPLLSQWIKKINKLKLVDFLARLMGLDRLLRILIAHRPKALLLVPDSPLCAKNLPLATFLRTDPLGFESFDAK